MPLAKTKLGVFGGTFNPIHNGHLALAEAVQKAHDLETVLFVPAARPPHKDRDLAPVEDRLEMVRIAVAGGLLELAPLTCYISDQRQKLISL